jgi:hypothetical protein
MVIIPGTRREIIELNDDNAVTAHFEPHMQGRSKPDQAK